MAAPSFPASRCPSATCSRNWTGRPFVFAYWAVRKAALAGLAPDLNVTRVFQQSRDNGLKHIPELVSAWAPKLGLLPHVIESYLTGNIDYKLDQENLEGLRLFYRYAADLKILPQVPELSFLEQPRLVVRS